MEVSLSQNKKNNKESFLPRVSEPSTAQLLGMPAVVEGGRAGKGSRRCRSAALPLPLCRSAPTANQRRRRGARASAAQRREPGAPLATNSREDQSLAAGGVASGGEEPIREERAGGGGEDP